jgi:hypothetical protein
MSDLIDYENNTHCYWTAGLLPESRPSFEGNNSFEEVMCVHEGMDEDRDGGWHMHVEISDIQTHPETWGVFLRDVARTLSVALAEKNDMTREVTEAIIERGFLSGNTFLPMKKEMSDA